VDIDLILVGGGLANSLIAYRLAMTRPQLRLLVIERGSALGGNHTWSFHEGDLTPSQHAWLAPLVSHAWPHYSVRFPGLERRLEAGYFSISSDRLHQVVGGALGEEQIRLESDVESLAPDGVVLAGGRRISATAVIDGRGDPRSPHLVLRYQKFLGQEVRLRQPHGLTGPILMDATVPQRDGYRFVYVLPFSDDVALIEDTYYSDGPSLSPESLTEEIQRYAGRQGWDIEEVLREEAGVLPIVLSGDIDAFWADAQPGLARSGLRAALFHPTTGYSLPDAVRLADEIAGAAELDAEPLSRLVKQRSVRNWHSHGIFRLVNRLLFIACGAHQRVGVMRRFYRLRKSLIERFYAGRPTWADRLRLVVGKPPCPFFRGVSMIFATGESKDGV
jgi:lycopene beta-cyclase